MQTGLTSSYGLQVFASESRHQHGEGVGALRSAVLMARRSLARGGSIGAESESLHVTAVLGRQGNEDVRYTLKPDALLMGTARYGVDSE